jgi:hypothetical protein
MEQDNVEHFVDYYGGTHLFLIFYLIAYCLFYSQSELKTRAFLRKLKRFYNSDYRISKTAARPICGGNR